ncbi:hypothetical protein D3C75_1383000 [compost metagenome]
MCFRPQSIARVLPRGSNGLMLLAGMLTHSATSGSIPRVSKMRTGKRRFRSGMGLSCLDCML